MTIGADVAAVPPVPAAYRPYRAWIAFVLSLPGLGLGHLYVARPGRAWGALAFTMFAVFPAGILLPILISRSVATTLLGFVITILLFLLVPIDAVLCARRARMHARVSWRWWMHFAGLFVVGGALLLSRPLWLTPYLPLRLSRIPTTAMVPTLLVGDTVIVDRRASTRASLAVGDLVVFASPGEPDKEYIKRLAGLPGSMVALRNGRLTVDGADRTAEVSDAAGADMPGETLGEHEYQVRVTSRYCNDWAPEKVPENSLFMLGDNRCNSKDSRSFGAIPKDQVRGRAVRIQWSQDPDTAKIRWERVGLDLTRH